MPKANLLTVNDEDTPPRLIRNKVKAKRAFDNLVKKFGISRKKVHEFCSGAGSGWCAYGTEGGDWDALTIELLENVEIE
jgi:hypothetical protein